MLKPALYNAMRLGAVVVPLAIVGVLGYDVGRTQATRLYQAQLASQQASHAKALQGLADSRANDLAQALAETQQLNAQAQQLGWALIQARARLADTQSQLKQRIPDAIRRDGQHWTGLGPDGLRVYRAALGYPARDPGVPASDAGDVGAAGAATGADAGLPPADLLEHAADYGQWCQRLDAQLSAFIRLHQEAQP